MTLDAEDIESIAARLAELLREQMPSSASRLADAAKVARELGVDREWVYAHAHELGGYSPRRRPWPPAVRPREDTPRPRVPCRHQKSPSRHQTAAPPAPDKAARRR